MPKHGSINLYVHGNQKASLGRTAQDVHLDSHTAPELHPQAWTYIYIYTGPCPKALTECSPLDFRRSSISSGSPTSVTFIVLAGSECRSLRALRVGAQGRDIHRYSSPPLPPPHSLPPPPPPPPPPRRLLFLISRICVASADVKQHERRGFCLIPQVTSPIKQQVFRFGCLVLFLFLCMSVARKTKCLH